jgi:glucose/arabinose dehydrogenase
MRVARAIRLWIVTSVLVAVVACGGGGGGDAEPSSTAPPQPTLTPPPAVTPQLDRSVFLSGLQSPWDLAFTPDGAVLFTEKCRGLSVRDANGTTRRLFGTSGAAVVASDLICPGQSGMAGVAVDPEFATNRFVYVYMSSSLSSPATNRVVRLTLNAGATSVGNRTDIITNISLKTAANAWGGEGSHSGGRIRFHPTEGLLYVTTGDNHNGPLPQDLNRLGGKVLRVTRDGSAAQGNGTPAGGDARIFTFGHRNVQGIAFRPSTGQPFSCEHGPGHTDEVTPLVAGGNSGWDPVPAQGVACADNYCGYISNNTNGTPTSMTDLGKFASAMRAAWTNDGNSQGMGPCAFLNGSQWSAWDGRLIVGIMGAQRVDVLQLDSGGTATDRLTVTGLPSARVRSLVQGPDGSLYVAVDAGEIWRLVPRSR